MRFAALPLQVTKPRWAKHEGAGAPTEDVQAATSHPCQGTDVPRLDFCY